MLCPDICTAAHTSHLTSHSSPRLTPRLTPQAEHTELTERTATAAEGSSLHAVRLQADLDAVRATSAPHRAESVMAAYLEQQEGTVGNVDAAGAVR